MLKCGRSGRMSRRALALLVALSATALFAPGAAHADAMLSGSLARKLAAKPNGSVRVIVQAEHGRHRADGYGETETVHRGLLAVPHDEVVDLHRDWHNGSIENG